MTNGEKVEDFHIAFGHAIDKGFEPELVRLRKTLIEEEVTELIKELDAPEPSRAKVLKELCDLLYVTYGAAVAFGLPVDWGFDQVHKSNMSKLGLDGKPIYRDDGKVLKGPKYREPDLSQVDLL